MFNPDDDLEAIADAEARAQVAEAKAEAEAAAAAAAAAAAIKEEEEERVRAAQNDPTVLAVVSKACNLLLLRTNCLPRECKSCF